MYTQCFPGCRPEKAASRTKSIMSIVYSSQHTVGIFWLLCYLTVLKEKTAACLQCGSVLHRREVWSLSGVYVTNLEMRVTWCSSGNGRTLTYPVLMGTHRQKLCPVLKQSKLGSSFACPHSTISQCFCISFVCLCMYNDIQIASHNNWCPFLCSPHPSWSWVIKVERICPRFPEKLQTINKCGHFLLKIETQLVWTFFLVDKENENCFVHFISSPLEKKKRKE